jgi:hypothetical protein
MRASVDTGSENPADLIDAAYSVVFFTAFERQFGLESRKSEIRDSLRNIGRQYIVVRRTEDGREMRRELRRQNAQLAKQTNSFLEILRATSTEEIAASLYMTALRLNEPIPSTKFAEISPHAQSQSGEPYFRELIRLLELLEKSSLEQADYFRERPGPKTNLGLEFLVRRVADYFVSELKRPFSVDHHKPIAASEAFDFISALIAPIDQVSSTEIMTAIRTEQNRRRNIGPKGRNKITDVNSQKYET